MIRFYILPIVRVEEPGIPGLARKPKYIPDLGVNWGMKHYGRIDAALVAADVTQAQHEQVMSNPDVETAPLNIDQNISDIAIPRVTAIMEQLRIPAGWVNNTFTYRQILRMIAGLFGFAQRHSGLHGEQLIDNQAQLDLRWNQIPLSKRQRILATADAKGYDYLEVTNQWTVRRILKHLADQWSDQVFRIKGFDL